MFSLLNMIFFIYITKQNIISSVILPLWHILFLLSDTLWVFQQAVPLTLHYHIMPSHLRHLWPLWPSLCSPINPPPRRVTAHAHLAGPAGRAAGPGLPGLPSIQSSWKSRLPILPLRKTIKTRKSIINQSQALGEISKGVSRRKNNSFYLAGWRKTTFF